MRKATLFTAAALLSALAVGATGTAGSTSPASTAVVKVAFNKKLKKTIVVDARGRTLYMFTADTSGTANCTAQLDPQCPKLWPALTTTGEPRVGKGIKASLLDTTTRAGGKLQVRYNNHPLYYFRNDKKSGDVEGQGFFNLWYVLSPKGTPIKKKVG